MNATRIRHRTVLPTSVTGRVLVAIAMVIGLTARPVPSFGQLFGKSLLIKNVTIMDATGEPRPEQDVMVKGERIAQVGPNLKAPMLTAVVDGTGMTITPGLIDAWSALGRLGAGDSGTAAGTAWDEFDRYDRDTFRQALQNGVTSVYVSPGAGPGVRGMGAVVSLVPGTGGAVGALISDDRAISINLGSALPGVQRLKVFAEVRAAFRKAREYRRALEDYEGELEDYLEELKKRREEKEKEEGEGDAKDSKKKNGKKKKSDGDKPNKPPKPKPDKPDQPEEKPVPPKDRWENAGTTRDAESFTTASSGESDTAPPKRRGRKGKGGKNKGSKNGEDEAKKEGEEDEVKKPTPPKPDRESEVLLRAIDHKLLVRIEAHRSPDILNAIELAEEFGLDILVEGATDAALVADQLAEAEVPVILSPVARTELHENNEYRRHNEMTAAALEHAGVRWTIGSGGQDAYIGRFVGMHAQLLAGRNEVEGGWLPLVTVKAAGMLGIRDRGRIRPGMRADLVLWHGDPADAASAVDRVYVDGKLAYQSKSAKKAGG